MRIFVKNKNRKEPNSSLKRGVGLPTHFIKVGGFTLIELLVVISIIGLLASIMIVSLGDSRDRGRDAVIQSSLLDVAQTAEGFAGDTGSYLGLCDTNDNTLSSNAPFGALKTVIANQGGVTTCRQSSEGFAVMSTMSYVDCWCVDYEAVSREAFPAGSETCADLLTGINCP